MFDDKYVSVDNNPNCKQTVQEIDAVGEVWEKIAKIQIFTNLKIFLINNVGNGDDIADAKNGVKNHHPVQECFGGLIKNELDQRDIGCQDQNVSYQRHKKYCWILATFGKSMFNIDECNTFQRYTNVEHPSLFKIQS